MRGQQAWIGTVLQVVAMSRSSLHAKKERSQDSHGLKEARCLQQGLATPMTILYYYYGIVVSQQDRKNIQAQSGSRTETKSKQVGQVLTG